jgi:signal transduction histidine kinase
MLDNAGKMEFLVFSLKDITEHKAAQEKLFITQKELESARRLSDIGVLAATVAHELRNPLGVIRTAAYNIKRKAQNPLLESHLNNIEKKILESDQIINNLLFYSRLKMPHYESVRICDILNESIDFVAKRFRGSNVSVIKKINPVKKDLIDADPVQMSELFNNILNNSYDACADRNGVIEIRAVKDKRGNIEMFFKDNGVGIDKEDLKNIFEPFFTTKAKGTGLGLTVCNQIVSLHQGRISIDSEKGKGTTVAVIVPVKRSVNGEESLNDRR